MKMFVKGILVFIIVALTTICCQNHSENDEVNFIKKLKVSIPHSKLYKVKCSQYEFDNNSDASIVHIIDEYGCTGCKISELARVEKTQEMLFESKIIRSVYIVSAPTEDFDAARALLKKYRLRSLTYIDTCNAFLSANPHIPDNEMFHTFVINNEGKVLMVGNPFANEKMETLFKKVIANERKKHKTKKSA